MTRSPALLVQEVLPHLFQGRAIQGVALLEQHAPLGPDPHWLGLLRLAIQRPGQPLLYYLKLRNLWARLGRPALKPNAARAKVVLLTDYTADGLAPLVALFAAGLGVQVEVAVAPFDSVEQLALDSLSSLSLTPQHTVILSLSEYWLKRYLGGGPLVAEQGLAQAQGMIEKIVTALLERQPVQVLVTNFAGRAYPRPGSLVCQGDRLGWNRAMARLGDWLGTLVGPRVALVDLAEAVFEAGGRAALGRLSYLRSKMIFEPAGTIAVARELAGALAHVSGKTHRALVTDWDNTIWGGEVADAGSHGVVCGLDSPDALAYHLVQQFIKSLPSTGVLLGAVSRNDPAVQKIFEDNQDLPLRLEDFASLQVSFTPKSAAIDRVCGDLGFGPEFLVYLDDSLFELAEVLTAHPSIDVLLAGPDGECTLRTLSEARFFNAVSLFGEDMHRAEAARALKQQRDLQAGFNSLEEFLKSIRIRLEVAPLQDRNRQRVVQMFQKSNQFNLTTRRHREQDLERLQDQGALIGVFSYEDTFGSQGVIAVINLVPRPEALVVESWVMSCRVLNRTVEQAVFAWMVGQAAGRPIRGEYLATEKNGLVKSLYERLGFTRTGQDTATGAELWEYRPGACQTRLPDHYTEIRFAA